MLAINDLSHIILQSELMKNKFEFKNLFLHFNFHQNYNVWPKDGVVANVLSSAVYVYI